MRKPNAYIPLHKPLSSPTETLLKHEVYSTLLENSFTLEATLKHWQGTEPDPVLLQNSCPTLLAKRPP